jgi:hypothetical protein
MKKAESRNNNRWPPDYQRRQTHPLYETWRGILKRCLYPKAIGYMNYGGRGITICKRWKDSFEAFVSDVGPRPSAHHTLDRKNNDGNYEPGNVRWATRIEQNSNGRFNRMISVNGKIQTMSAWAKANGLPKSTVFNRLRLGWDEIEAVTKPSRPKRGTR